MQRRILYAILILATLFAGLASRQYDELFPSWINIGLGDALWALLVFWVFAFLAPISKPRALFSFTLLFSFAVEASQLYQAPWINEIRATTLGALILGHGFLWTDLLAYTIGASFGGLMDHLLIKRSRI